jgi:hypothetical protein
MHDAGGRSIHTTALDVFSQGVLKYTTRGADLGPTGRCDQNPSYVRSTKQDINLDSGHVERILLYTPVSCKPDFSSEEAEP